MVQRHRAVLYLRQSVSHDDSISLDLQEVAGRDYCARQGYDVVAVESDPGITGRTWKRPAVQRTMAMLEDGRADVVVLWKWSRLSRSRRDWAVAADRAEVAGGRIESATETVDVSTATGRLARGVLVEFAAFESERIGEVWKEVHARRVKDGLPPTGKPKWGYVYDADAKLHRPDPKTGPVLAALYDRYLAGESMYALARWLNLEGHQTLSGGVWSDRTLRRVLDAGFAAGWVSFRGQLHPGRHEPLVDEDTWQAYLDARAVRRGTPPRSERSQYLLSGMVRCATCGGTMQAGLFGHKRVPKFRCYRGRESLGARCPGGYVTAKVLEEAVLDWLHEQASDVDAAAAAAAGERARGERAAGDAVRLAREVTRVEEAMHRLTVQSAESDGFDDAYRSAMGELAMRRDRLVEQVEVAGREQRAADRDVAATAQELLAAWERLPVAGRREVLRGLIDHVRVVHGRPRGIVSVVPAWNSQV